MKIKFLLLLLALSFTVKSYGEKATATDPISLAGQWRFSLDRNDTGLTEHWFSQKLTDKIKLPGILESQGYGDEISTTTPWVLSLYDHFWFMRADYASYTNSGHVKVPFISQPPRHYIGAAWYQRDIEIPKNWDGKHVVLFMERPHWKSTVWLDDKEIGSDISLCVPHEYDFGLMTPGKHRLTVRVDNRMIMPYRLDAHSVSDSLGNAWNGIIGRIELRATPPVWINEVRVFPDVKEKSALVRGHIGNATAQIITNKIWLGIMSGAMQQFVFVQSTNQTIAIPPGGTDFEMKVFSKLLASDWDEFHPMLYSIASALGDPNWQVETVRYHIFGFRELHTDGNQFILNGHPIYFRGTHFGGDFPLTGYPPTDVASWEKIFQTCKEYGLNHMRFHSWCPPEAAFDAADELGFYLQVECGMWNDFSPGGAMEKQLYSETDRILRKFGNHPSLMLVSASNEAHGNWKPVLSQWVKHFRAEDPRHLYTPDTGWALIESVSEPINGGADYLAVGRIGQNRVRGERGWFGADYGESVAGIPVPVIAHEVGQWVAYPDFDVIKKFTGFMRPGNYEIFRDSAKAHGLLKQNKQFAFASGLFQLECYKEEIEANLRSPGLAGIQLLDLHDYTGQGTALVGVLDSLWEPKSYTAGQFGMFCNTVVPLARLKQRVFTTADTLEAPVEIANYSASALTNAESTWEIRGESNHMIMRGIFPPYDHTDRKKLSTRNSFNRLGGTPRASRLPFSCPSSYYLKRSAPRLAKFRIRK